MSWNRAIDEVHVARLIKTYKDNGELNSEDPALLMLKQWPASRHYKNCPDTLPSLAQMVCNLSYWYTSLMLSVKVLQCKMNIS